VSDPRATRLLPLITFQRGQGQPPSTAASSLQQPSPPPAGYRLQHCRACTVMQSLVEPTFSFVFLGLQSNLQLAFCRSSGPIKLLGSLLQGCLAQPLGCRLSIRNTAWLWAWAVGETLSETGRLHTTLRDSEREGSAGACENSLHRCQEAMQLVVAVHRGS
jgi:hypothetical protein